MVRTDCEECRPVDPDPDCGDCGGEGRYTCGECKGEGLIEHVPDYTIVDQAYVKRIIFRELAEYV